MGRKKMGVGAISVTLPLEEMGKMQKCIEKENISRSRLVTLALQNFLNSETRINDYITQNEDFSNEIKELKETSEHYEKEAERLAHNLKVQGNWLDSAKEEIEIMKKDFNLERKDFNVKHKELEKEIKKLNRKLVSIDKIIKK